ncbi:MAG: DEAD/DEAH box helicase family protein [Magnetococcales bacterium]|nr:DEAD/DEAH box helicase family protein [Magnetococcales bacterium]
MVSISFDQGTLCLQATPDEMAPVASYVQWDERSHCYRARGCDYGPILRTLHHLAVAFDDQARQFQKRDFQGHGEPSLRPHQQQALQAWHRCQQRGVIVLPTGSGKSLVARRAITLTGRDTLILVPTIDLLHQWFEQLSAAFQQPIGLMGGGDHELHPITVSTYDSALIHIERIGNRFGLLICDECHHLPAPTTRHIAILSIAPFRLGLTATPERNDGSTTDLDELLGPICHRSEITELEGSFLSPYHLETIPINLDADEQQAYITAYQHYRQFASINGISFSRENGWQQFIQVCARSKEGRDAFAAYRMQKQLARASRAKLRAVWSLLRQHHQEQAIIFTDDNATAYTIGEVFILPVITHRTRVSERKRLLDLFRSQQLPVLVTSRVLNEGVDVPDVSVGIIVSGTGSVREHVQRLGRILRPRAGKQAVLYELVSAETSETFTSERRRQHLAYQKEFQN